MPLTNSLYVKGNISQPDRVLVDIGTGFYVEKVRTLLSAAPLTAHFIYVWIQKIGRQQSRAVL